MSRRLMRLAAGLAATFAAVTWASARQLPTPELLLDQGKRAFEAFRYDEALPYFDRLVTTLTTGGQVQRQELLVQGYELRARTRFALGDSSGAEQDFAALLSLNPGFKLGAEVSPRVLAILDAVRKVTIGQIQLSITPAGEVQIAGRAYQATPTPTPIDLTVGEHAITATRSGYTPLATKVTVTAGAEVAVAIVLERVSATLTFSTVPAEVDVIWNGERKGATARGTGDTSSPFVLGDLPTGSHRLILRRACFKDEERAISIPRPDDLTLDPVRLSPSVATVTITPSDPNAVVLVDGARRGTGAMEIANLCEGPHVIEARGAKGRFVDRRAWATGDKVALKADLRAAFPIVSSTGVPAAGLERLKTTLERALDPARTVLVYFPVDVDLAAAIKAEDPPAGWLTPEAPGEAGGTSRITREVRKDVGQKLAARLESQGVAAIRMGADPNVVTLAVLASGSGEAETLTINLADPPSRTRAVDFLGATLPPLLRAALDASVVDVLGVTGATVIRVGPSAAKAGLAVGDVIVAAGGAPVASVTDLRARIAAVKGASDTPALDVRGAAGGAPRTVAGAIALATETFPPREATLPYNRALLDLQGLVAATTGSAAEKRSAQLNLGIVHMRLGSWDEALAAFSAVQLPEGSGVSAGTVAYYVGLCLEALGRQTEAAASFAKAAAATEARLSLDGPLVAPLAQRKLGARR